MEKMKMQTPGGVEMNLDRIAQLFPGCITETRDEKGAVKRAVDFDLLRQELSGDVVEGPVERYQLNWPGKRQAVAAANAPINKTLRPCEKESVNFDTTGNLYIEGDNLDALKLLQETYLGKIKMIYIDPPYNTGNDFIYKDNFTADKGEYEQESGQRDESGGRLVANTESNGRYHSDWLSMMLPRLRLARNLLREDGAIFVSIGVEEIANLKAIMNEVFGEKNFIEVFSWVKTATPPALSTKSRKTNEYIVCYEKSKNSFQYNGEALDGGSQPLLNSGNAVRTLRFPKETVYFNEEKFPNGIYKAGKPDRVELNEDIEIVNGYAQFDFSLSGEFKWTQDFLNEEIVKGTQFVIKSEKLSIRFIRDEEGFKRPANYIKEKHTTPLIDKPSCGVDTNEGATTELSELLGGTYFDHPKPVSLLQYITNFMTGPEDTILDFFSGSATTAHAVMRLNQSDQGRRKFIMVQLEEDLDERLAVATGPSKKLIENAIEFLDSLNKPHLVTEIGKERIRRAGTKILEELEAKRKAEAKEPDLLSDATLDRHALPDVGFRVLKVDSSNMKDVWYTPDQLKQHDLELFTAHIKEDRTAEDLLFQIMLDWGSPTLDAKIRKEKVGGKTVFIVNENDILACFEEGITEKLVKQMAAFKPLRAVFRDDAFDDSLKINVEQIFKVLSPGTEVKSI